MLQNYDMHIFLKLFMATIYKKKQLILIYDNETAWTRKAKKKKKTYSQLMQNLQVKGCS
jgi:hypothetical protein